MLIEGLLIGADELFIVDVGDKHLIVTNQKQALFSFVYQMFFDNKVMIMMIQKMIKWRCVYLTHRICFSQ